MSVVRSVLISIAAALAVASAGFAGEALAAENGGDVSASVKDAQEKRAFSAAKRLDTVEAWEAFVERYPRGSRANIARSFLRRLDEPAGKPHAFVRGCFVTRVAYKGGELTMTRSGGWLEQSGRKKFRFEESSRTENIINLHDASRRVSLTADLAGRVIWRGKSRRKLYDIVDKACGSVEPRVMREPLRPRKPGEPPLLNPLLLRS